MANSDQQWSGKRVLVTGAGGFIGSHLAERLTELGAKVRALVRYNSTGRWGWLDTTPLAGEMEVLAGDVCDPDCVHRAVAGVDIVFHLAALIGIPYSFDAPHSYLRTNVEGSLNVFQASLKHNVERVVHTSTSEVYGTALYVPIDEKHPLQSQSPYAATKVGADRMAESFHRSFGLPVVILRPFNTYGPRQSARAVIPTIISQCAAGGPVQLGSLTPTRDLNFVSDTVEAFVCAAGSVKAEGQEVNVGTGREISIGDLAKTIMKIMNVSCSVECQQERVRPRDSEVERLVAANDRARDLLDWQPFVSLDEGLRCTIAWLKDNRDAFRPGAYAV